MIEVGQMAPDFTLESTRGPLSLSAYRTQKNVVLLFYPQDDTGG